MGGHTNRASLTESGSADGVGNIRCGRLEAISSRINEANQCALDLVAMSDNTANRLLGHEPEGKDDGGYDRVEPASQIEQTEELVNRLFSAIDKLRHNLNRLDEL